MLQAIIRGKAPTGTQDSEDVLTSCVFGPLQYGVEDTYLVHFLGQARGLDGSPLLSDASSYHVQNVDLWQWVFPHASNRAQPDAIVTLADSSGSTLILLVECKLWSPKSSMADAGDLPMDQLARELLALEHMRYATRIKNAALVYLTADHKLPRRDFEEAFIELVSKGYPASRAQVYWAGWQQLHELLLSSSMWMTKVGERFGTDLRELLERLDLVSFRFFSWPTCPVAMPTYQFSRTRRRYAWRTKRCPKYTFTQRLPRRQWSWLLSAGSKHPISSIGAASEWRFGK